MRVKVAGVAKRNPVSAIQGMRVDLPVVRGIAVGEVQNIAAQPVFHAPEEAMPDALLRAAFEAVEAVRTERSCGRFDCDRVAGDWVDNAQQLVRVVEDPLELLNE